MLIVSVFCTALFVGGFVYDSEHIVEKNSRLHQEGGFIRLWTGTYWGIDEPGGLYRPLTLTTYWVEFNILGFTEPWQFVAVNLLLHFFVVVLLFELGFFWLDDYWATLAGASLFAVHPIGTAVIPNIVGRADLLATAFLLVSLLAWEFYRRSSNGNWVLLTIIGWFLALCSKESAVVLPLIILIRDVIGADGQRVEGSPLSVRHPWAYAGLGLTGLSWFVIRTGVLGGVAGRVLVPLQNPLAYLELPVRLLTATKILGLYVLNALVPVNLSADYSFRAIGLVRSPLSFEFVLSFLLLGLILGLTVILGRHRPLSGLGFMLFFVALAPVSNLFVTIGTIMADRLLYLPLTGFFLSLAYLLVVITGGSSSFRSLVLVCIVGSLLGFYGAQTLRRNTVWENGLTLWSRTVREAPKSVVANYLYAIKLLKHETSAPSSRRALRHGRKAVKLAGEFPGPTPVEPYHGYALALMQRVKTVSTEKERESLLKEGQRVLKEAKRSLEEDFESGYDYRPNGPRVERFRYLYHDLGSIQLELGELRKAKQNLRRTLELDANASDWALLGKVELRRGNSRAAVRYLKRAVDLQPRNSKFQQWLKQAEVKTTR